MGDMRASNYALWPWPLMLDPGERVKVKLRVPGGRLILFGVIEETPHAVDEGRNRLRFKLDMEKEYTFYFAPDKGERVTLNSSDASRQFEEGILWGVSMTGWFVADSEYENVWGLHMDDIKAAQDKSDRLCMASPMNPVPLVEEPGT